MKLVTWNVNSLKVRLPRVLEFVEQHRPDVLCLQETKTEDAAFPADELREAGLFSAHHSAGRWAGVAVLATEEPQDVVTGLPGEAVEDEARWIEATVHGLRVASAYVPNGRAGACDVVVGDLNVTREDADVYDPQAFAGSTHVTPEERSRFEAILGEGLVDAYRALHPDEVGFTWWDYRQGHFHRKMGLRIDYVLVAERHASRLRSCGIDRNYRKGSKPSDHAPLICELG